VATGFGAAFHAGRETLPPDVAAAHLLAVMDRLTPDDTGGFFDWQGQPVPW
jgi:hypothetical protein